MTRQINHKSILGNENGMVLAVTLMMIAVLVLLGTTAVMTVTTDLKIAGNYRQSQVALYNAEAGVETVIAYLRTTTVTYPTANAGATVITANDTCSSGSCTQIPVTATSGSGISFAASASRNTPVYLYGKDVANKLYVFRMTGTGANNASKTIEAYIGRSSDIPPGTDGAAAMYGGGPAVQFKTGGGGGYALDGHDYPVPIDPNCNGSDCDTTASSTLPAVPGLFTVQSPTLSGDVTAHLGGIPTQEIGPSRETEYNDFVNYVITNGLYQSTLGTRANPAVTLIPSGSTLSGSVNGAGIIIVDDGGALSITGNFCYEGLVILRGTGRVFGAGTGNLFGSIITISHLSKLIDLTGSFSLYYSSTAISNLSKISSLSTTKKTAWRDVF